MVKTEGEIDMKLSDIVKICSDLLEIVSDCDFDSLYLVGKEFEENRKYISFVGSSKYIEDFYKYNISGVICTEEVAEIIKNDYQGGIAVTHNPKKAFFEIHNQLGNQRLKCEETYIDATANICKGAIIAENNVYIAENVDIYSNVIIKEGTYIGKNSIIREGSVLGGPAFYYFGEGNERKLVNSTGTVRIGNNVELHANVIVEKGVMYGETLIGDNSKIDNNVVIGHDSKVGKNCTIAGNSILAGGVVLEEDTFLGVSATIAPNVTVGRGGKISSGAVVTKNVAKGKHVSGNFAIEHDRYIDHIKDISK